MLIDDVTIKAQAGRGGPGKVSFDKNKMAIGPTGGNGGRGGSIYLKGVPNLNALEHFRYKKEIAAGDGEEGRGQFVDGSDGKDLEVEVPVGTVIHNLTTGFEYEITKVDEKILVAQGGKGGKGNYKFRSATNTSPKEAQPGLPGEDFELRLELKLIADVGFIGLPNAGKSTLLNVLTNAKAKVANYPFTTLEPNLGSYYGLILADIPGLIEGASTGKGLGVKFLRHIERTKILFHFISAESTDIERDYRVIREELKRYNPVLADKPEYLFLSKKDLLSPSETEKILTKIKKLNYSAVAISILDDESLEPLKVILNRVQDKNKI